MRQEALVKTGIAGLDEILLGGIPRANVILVQGETGTGKTLFGIGIHLPGNRRIRRTRHDRRF